jgi:hypothetical protein
MRISSLRPTENENAVAAGARGAGFRFLVLAFVVLSGCRTVDPALHKAHLPCGLYRWPVKTLADPDAKSVRWEPIDTTLKHLAELPRPSEVHRSLRTRSEYYVYRVRAVLFAVHTQVDQDMHLLLRDPEDPDLRMLAEIPSPACTSDSGQEPSFEIARQIARSLRKRKREILVEVTGVGFFDALRKHGGAPNGFELHPVVRLLEIGAPPTESARR